MLNCGNPDCRKCNLKKKKKVSYIKFKLLSKQKPKTAVYDVISKNSGIVLGQIKWNALWRQYCFFPFAETIFNPDCLVEINKFIYKLMRER